MITNFFVSFQAKIGISKHVFCVKFVKIGSEFLAKIDISNENSKYYFSLQSLYYTYTIVYRLYQKYGYTCYNFSCVSPALL